MYGNISWICMNFLLRDVVEYNVRWHMCKNLLCRPVSLEQVSLEPDMLNLVGR